MTLQSKQEKMTRKSKFSFLSMHLGSSSEKNEHTTTKQRTPVSGPSSPAFGSMSKAEELLGPSETGGATQQLEGSSRCHTAQRLRKKCSALSITIAECGFNTSRLYRRTGKDERTKAYSPALGSADNISVTSSIGRSLRHKRSTSTIHSHYDPASCPLAVSQQTSASSTRDMALRKGCPPVLSPLRYTTLQDSAKNSRPEKKIPKKKAELTQRRVTRVDLSTLFPQAQHSELQLDPHLEIETSTSVMVVDSGNHSLRPLPLRSWTGQKIIKITDQPDTAAEARKNNVHNVQIDNDERSGALPLAPQLLQPAKDVENWLDDAELDDKFDTMGEETTLQMFVRGKRNSTNSSGHSSDQSSSSVRTMTSQVSPVKRQPQLEKSDQAKPSSEKAIAAVTSHHTSQEANMRDSKIIYGDLLLESVLLLSSSEDDSDIEIKPKMRSRRNSKQDRLMVPILGNDPLPKPAEPKPNTTQQHPEGILDQRTAPASLQNIPALSPDQSPTYPRKYGQPFDKRSTSPHWPPDMIRDPHPLHPSSQISPPGKKLKATYNDIKDPPSTPIARSYLEDESPRSRLSRMMAVSPEEEKLLSAMRRKRASMRKTVLAEGISPAMEHGLTTPRPKTADTDRPASSFFEPDMTLFPIPPGLAAGRQHRNPLRRVSSEDLRLMGVGGYHLSSSSSSIASGLIPSPALSHEVPLTPASVGYTDALEGFGDEESERYDEFGSEGQVKARSGHVRKRTMSSVLCLDGVEERARQREEEEDLAMWGTDRCI